MEIFFFICRYGLNSKQFYNGKDRTLNGKNVCNGKDVVLTINNFFF